MEKMLLHRERPAELLLTRECSVRADSVKEDDFSVEAVISTDAPTLVYDPYSGRVIEEVLLADGCMHGDQVPLLNNHYRYSNENVWGAVRDIRVEDGKVIARMYFDDEDEAAMKCFKKVKKRMLTDVSVGYRSDPEAYEDLLPGQSKAFNGKTYKAGKRALRITKKWALKETSVVPIGADQQAKFRSEFGSQMGLSPLHTRREVASMNEQLRRYLEANFGLRKDASPEEAQAVWDGLTSEKRAEIEAEMKRAETPAPTPTPAPAGVDADQIRKEEQDRVRAINALAGDDVPAEVIRKALDDGLTVDQARAEVLKAVRENRSKSVDAPNLIFPKEATREVLAMGVTLRAGLNPIDPKLSDEKKRAAERLADAGEKYRDYSLLDICRMHVGMTGAVDPLTGSTPYGREATIRAAVSSGTLQHVFSAAVHASLMGGYQEAADNTDFVSVTDHTDFKTHEVIDVTTSAGLDRLGRGGTAKHASLSDSKEGYKIARYAKQFVVDEQDIIDDNLNAIQDVPRQMGQAAARIRPDMVYALIAANPNLADGGAVFLAARNNITAAALDSGSLKASRAAFVKQQKNGVNLELKPAFLVCATELEDTARELIQSTQILRTGAAGSEYGTKNVIADYGLQVRSSARISNGVTNPITGTAYAGSATAWYLFAAPSMAKTIEVAYLAGTGRRPTMRSFVLSQGQYGVGYDIKLDIGASWLDYRGASKGNA